jgi:hypothetical protein
MNLAKMAPMDNRSLPKISVEKATGKSLRLSDVLVIDHMQRGQQAFPALCKEFCKFLLWRPARPAPQNSPPGKPAKSSGARASIVGSIGLNA